MALPKNPFTFLCKLIGYSLDCLTGFAFVVGRNWLGGNLLSGDEVSYELILVTVQSIGCTVKANLTDKHFIKIVWLIHIVHKNINQRLTILAKLRIMF